MSTTIAQAAGEYSIYTDSLTPGWANWSWGSSISFGPGSLSFTPNSAWSALYLHTDNAVNTTGLNVLHFAARATTSGEKFQALIYDSNNQPLKSVPLANYGGDPTVDSWKIYNIPLSDLNASSKQIKGVVIQEALGHAQPTLYLNNIELDNSSSTGSTPVQTTPTPIQSTLTPTPIIGNTRSGNPLAGISLFNDQNNNPAAIQKQQWQSSRPADAAMMDKIANQPKAIWMGNWNGNITSDTKSMVDRAQQANSLPVLIAYNIPNRDCGSYSAGGSSSKAAYQDWINGLASGIGNRRAAVILEPDALAQITCLPADGQQQRYDMLKYAVSKLKSLGNTVVYLDAAHAGWISASDMTQRLKNGGVTIADGFSINVANFDTDAVSIAYGQQISSQLGGKHFVIDTSRNGNGPALDNSWCNPAGRALGNKPTLQTGNALVDAYLWLKYPGESDGSCNGGPTAGQWYADYALGLAQRASW